MEKFPAPSLPYAYGSTATESAYYAPPHTEVTVNTKPRYQDLWAAVLFWLLIIGFIVLAAFSIPAIRNDATSVNPIPTREMTAVLCLGLAAASAMSVLYYHAMLRYPKQLVTLTFYFAIASNFLMAIFFLYQGQWGAAAIWLVLGFLFVFVYWSWRSRIPFAVITLKNALDVAKAYPSLFFIAFAQLVLVGLWTALWSVTTTGLTIKFAGTNTNGTNSASTGQIFLWVFSIFSMYWVSQVISNIGHVAVAGLYATYYFLGVQTPSGQVELTVPNPVGGALKRACTTSFGSVCYGSLIIAVIETLRTLAQQQRDESSRDGNILCTFIMCCMACILQCLGDLLNAFNTYAFAEVAIYGKDYCSAAKDTWALVKRKGIDAIINDNLVGNVLTMGTFLVGILTAAVGGIYVAFSSSAKASWQLWSGSDNPAGAIALAAIVCLAIGMAIFSCVSSIISSGVSTTFVCMAEDPAALQRTKPQFYQDVVQAYPQVVL